MPSVRNVRVATSNTAKALESCVTLSTPVRGSREMRKVPSTHPATAYPPACDSFQEQNASSLTEVGVPSTLAVRCPTRPPGKRRVITSGRLPFIVSSTSAVVTVQMVRFPELPAHDVHAPASSPTPLIEKEAEPRERGGLGNDQQRREK